MKVLLINPNYHPDSPTSRIDPVPPLGLMYIASFLEKYEFNVKIIDAFFEKLTETELSKRILKFSPDIVGITSDSINYSDSLKVASICKTILNPIIILGGYHATLRRMEIIRHPDVDIVVVGEGEITMFEICTRILENRDLIDCSGTVIKINDNIICNPLRERNINLDLLPFPSRHLINFKGYNRNYLFGELDVLEHPIDRINSSRGCPYNCSFCSSREIWGKEYSVRSPENIVDEIEFLIRNYNTKSIYFREDNFTFSNKRVFDICNEIQRRGIKIDWVCSSRINQVDKHILKRMAEAGCKAIWYGIESGSEKTLKILNKGITMDEIRNAIKITKETGIVPGASFMIGIPGESLDEINDTINLIKELKLKKSTILPFMAIPDSRLYRMVKEKGLYDSSYGEMLNVVTKEFDRELLDIMLIKLMKDLKNIWRKDNLKKKPLKYFLKYGIKSIIHPKEFIRSIRK